MIKEIQVRIDEEGNPRGFFHNGGYWRIREIIDTWRDTGQWWEGEAEKIFFRVTVLPVRGEGVPALCEIYADVDGDHWVLYLIYD